MSITRPRKKRILEKAGLRYVAGWLPKEQAEEVLSEISAEQDRVDEILARIEQ